MAGKAARVDPGPVETIRRIEAVFRDVYGQAVATLVRVFGDITLAEDAVQHAFVVAAERWGRDGIPPNPAGWIVTTARNRAIDQHRRTTRGRELESEAGDASDGGPDPFGEALQEEEPVPDDRLRLIFTCCHPALRIEHQVALTLRLLGGLTTEEIARGFLVTEPAMARRLGRAKYKIKAAKIPYRVPAQSDLAQRLKPVLSVVYLIYNAGTGELTERAMLRREAVRLGRALVILVPDEPEAAGLLALMLLNESRVHARNVDGALVLLRDQNRSRWDRDLISEGHSLVRECVRRGRPGPLQLQAAIQAVHCSAETFEATDWPQIVALYDHLLSVLPTPVVALNRAIAVSQTDGPAAALEELDLIAIELDGYSSLHAARAATLRSLGRIAEATDAYSRAAELADSSADRKYFTEQIQELGLAR